MSRVCSSHVQYAHTPRRVAKGSPAAGAARVGCPKTGPPTTKMHRPPTARLQSVVWPVALPLGGAAKRDPVPGLFWKEGVTPRQPPRIGCSVARGGAQHPLPDGAVQANNPPPPPRQTHPAFGLGGGLWRAVAEWKAAGDHGGNNQPFDGQNKRRKIVVSWRGGQRAAGRHSLASAAALATVAPRLEGVVVADGRTRLGRVDTRFVAAGEVMAGPARGRRSRAHHPQNVLMGSCGGGGSCWPRKRNDGGP